MIEKVDHLALRLFGKHIHQNEDGYVSLRRDLNSANLPIPWDVYVARGYVYATVVASLALLVLGAAVYVAMLFVQVPPFVRIPGPLQPFQDLVLQNRQVLGAIIGAVLVAPLVGGLTFFGYLALPHYQTYSRSRNIDLTLASAVTFLYAMTRGGANIIEALRELSDSEQAYGDVSREASLLMRDMEFFGEDINTALRNRVELSPSKEFSDFCASLISILDSGGDVTQFLREKAEEYERESLQAMEAYLETLGMLAETYTTAFVAGPIFIIIMTSVMTLMQGGGGGAATMALYVTTYAVLPIGTAMFVVLIDMLSPEEAAASFQPFKIDESSRKHPELDGEQGKRFRKVLRSERMYKWSLKLKEPHRPFIDNPYLGLALGVPVGLIILAIGLATAPWSDLTGAVNHSDDFVIASVFVMILPLSVFHELKVRRLKGIRHRVPDLLSQLASMNEMGLTLVESFHHVGGGNNLLSIEMAKVQDQLSWGEEISLALKQFTNRVKSAFLLQVMTLITRALRASGNVSQVLRIAAEDALRRREVERERGTQIFVYVVIIYLSFLVFLAIIAILAVKFLPVMQQPTGGGGAAASGMTIGGNIDIELFKRTFFHATVVQGFSSGLVAGKMGEGSVLSGLKHSLVMMTIAYVAFLFML
ncbi:MAG: hypothetical protein MAG715_00954 [Methanonatronarchaeales archaeon]|nr:hypothetical protein [Methanonatronarchaeales archaeon]